MTQQMEQPKAKKSAAKRAAVNVPASQRGLGAYAPELGDQAAAHVPTTPVLVPVAQIWESAANARRAYDEAELEGLAQSIRREGLLHPIEIREALKQPGDGLTRYEIVAGHRRFRATKLLGLDRILAFVRGDVDETAARAHRAIENLQRAQLTPYEEGLAYASLTAQGLTQQQVADQVGVSLTKVKERLRLADLGDDLGGLVGKALSVEAALQLAPFARHARAKELVPVVAGAVRRYLKEEKYSVTMRGVFRAIDEDLTKGGLVPNVQVDWRLGGLLESKKYRPRLMKLDHVAITKGGGEERFYLDVQGFLAIVAEAQAELAKEAEKQAKIEERSGAGTATAADQEAKRRFDAKVEREAARRLYAAAGKLARSTVRFGKPQIQLVAEHLAAGYWNQAMCRTLAVILETEEKVANPEAIVEAAAKKGEAELARVAYGLVLAQIATSGDTETWERIVKHDLHTSPEQVEKKVRAELTAAKKAGKKAPEKKPAPAADEDEED